MAGEVIVDALPYIDHGYDDVGVRESVNIRISMLHVETDFEMTSSSSKGSRHGGGGMPAL